MIYVVSRGCKYEGCIAVFATASLIKALKFVKNYKYQLLMDIITASNFGYHHDLHDYNYVHSEKWLWDSRYERIVITQFEDN